ncbi:MAG: hypothetical protein CMC55_08760 [Flavobacteriaceae bacterium]|nr:hypothetical protein [Flavobacteriaceae bacterium]
MSQLYSIPEQAHILKQLNTVFQTYKSSKAEIRPHFMLTGPSGSGKSVNIQALAKQHKIDFIEINAAQLTCEGVSGNSLSKALAPLRELQEGLTVVFVDEFDKLFIRGSTNSELAHDTTLQVQNEFLKLLEADSTAVFGDYGKYINVDTSRVLYVFAGAFNGAQEVNQTKLKSFGIRTEFLGRVNLCFNMPPIEISTYMKVLENHPLIKAYLKVYKEFDFKKVVKDLKTLLEPQLEQNIIGLRLISSVIHNYFINELNKDK